MRGRFVYDQLLFNPEFCPYFKFYLLLKVEDKIRQHASLFTILPLDEPRHVQRGASASSVIHLMSVFSISAVAMPDTDLPVYSWEYALSVLQAI